MPIEGLKDFDPANPPESLLNDIKSSIPEDTDVKDTPEPAKADAKPEEPADDVDDVESEADDQPAKKAAEGEKPKRTQAENLKIALKKEREEKRAIERKVAEAETRLGMIQQAIEAQQKQAQQAQQQPETPAEQPPDINTDPIGYFQWRDSQREREIAELRQYHSRMSQAQQQAMAERQVTEAYAAKAAAFAAKTPDFDGAYKHMVNFRTQQLKLMGYDDATAGQILKNDELGLAYRALQSGQDPAEIIYNMAKASGYTPKQAEAIAAAATEQTEQQPAPNPAVQQIAEANKKAAAAKSLTNATGKAQSNMTIERLLELPMDEFAKATEGANWEKIMGGISKKSLFN